MTKTIVPFTPAAAKAALDALDQAYGYFDPRDQRVAAAEVAKPGATPEYFDAA